jgi:hypothetical protein
MKCRHCGTEIAEKALICYRCGAATTDPVRMPVTVRSRRGGTIVSLVAMVLLILLGLYLGQAGRTMEATRGRTVEAIAAACIGIAIVILLVRILHRRRS